MGIIRMEHQTDERHFQVSVTPGVHKLYKNYKQM